MNQEHKNNYVNFPKVQHNLNNYVNIFLQWIYTSPINITLPLGMSWLNTLA